MMYGFNLGHHVYLCYFGNFGCLRHISMFTFVTTVTLFPLTTTVAFVAMFTMFTLGDTTYGTQKQGWGALLVRSGQVRLSYVPWGDIRWGTKVCPEARRPGGAHWRRCPWGSCEVGLALTRTQMIHRWEKTPMWDTPMDGAESRL
jgi:hypothetical protein